MNFLFKFAHCLKGSFSAHPIGVKMLRYHSNDIHYIVRYISRWEIVLHSHIHFTMLLVPWQRV